MFKSALPGLIAATLAAVLYVFPALAQDQAEGTPLSGDEIKTLFDGLSVVGSYDTGDFFEETYHSDGTISYRDEGGPLAGHWKVKGDQFCTEYVGGEKPCWIVVRHGENCFAYHLSESKVWSNRLPPDSKWLSIGWNPALPSTCGAVLKPI